MSDYNSSIKKSSVVSRSRVFRDLDLSLSLHPLRRDILPLKDLDAVKTSVRNIVLTNFYERPFSGHYVAGNLRSKLFDNNDMFTVISIKKSIQDALEKNEPRVIVERLTIIDKSDRNGYEVTIQFRIRSTSSTEETKIYLKRLR